MPGLQSSVRMNESVPSGARLTATTTPPAAVKFRENGLDEIEVEDNGRGIDKEDWPGLGEPLP